LGQWVLRLAPFKFRVRHTRGVDTVVADALSRIFEGENEDGPELVCASLLEYVPLVYSSLGEHQGEDMFCKDIKERVLRAKPEFESYQIHKDPTCYFPKGARRCRWLVPSVLRCMTLKYFHDSALSGHLGAFKPFCRITTNFW
jgi:hypothetical protein